MTESPHTWPHPLTPYHVPSHLTVSPHTLPRSLTPHHIASHLTVSPHTWPCTLTPYRVASHLTVYPHTWLHPLTPNRVPSHLTMSPHTWSRVTESPRGQPPTDPLTLKYAISQSNKDFTTDVSKVCRFLGLSEWKQCDSKHPSKWQTDSTVTIWERSTSFWGKGIPAEAPHCNTTQWSGLRIMLSSCWRPLNSNDVFSSNRKQTHCCLPSPIAEKRATILIPRVSHKFQPHLSFPLFRFLQCLQKGQRQG